MQDHFLPIRIQARITDTFVGPLTSQKLMGRCQPVRGNAGRQVLAGPLETAFLGFRNPRTILGQPAAQAFLYGAQPATCGLPKHFDSVDSQRKRYRRVQVRRFHHSAHIQILQWDSRLHLNSTSHPLPVGLL